MERPRSAGGDDAAGLEVEVAPSGHLVVRVLGPRFGLSQAQAVGQLADSRFPGGKPRVILNLAPVEYIDSTGVSLFVRLSLQGDVRLCHLTPTAAGILMRMQILPLLRVHPTEADARSDA